MDLSVVMPTLNKADLLSRTLDALAQQTLPADVVWEVVVVDDGSTDHTPALLLQKQAAFPVPLQIVSPGRNVGRAKARNLGISQACGRWILFLDDDILAPQDLLASHLKVLAGHKEWGTIGYAVTETSLIDGPHFHYMDSRGVAHRKSGFVPGRFFVTQNAAAPRWALEDVGGFQEDFSGYGFEDMELAFRLEDICGIQFRAMTQSVPRHIHHHTLAAYLEKKVECGRSSLPLLAQLHASRLAEMRLNSLIEGSPDDEHFLGKFWRFFLDSPMGRIPRHLVSHWPCFRDHRPLAFGLYVQMMNLTILSCFRQGILSQTNRQDPAKNTSK